MKKVYWRPRTVSRTGLGLIAIISLAGLLVVEQFRTERRQPHFDLKLAAAQRAREAFDIIKSARVDLGPPIDDETDPLETGIVGLPMSPVTTVTGYLNAKQTSVNPNFAAVVIDMLKEAGVEPDDVVAMGVSGSFPALNACAFAAVESLGAKPVSIASVSASNWGANVPDLLWIDMERYLFEAGALKNRSIAASIGGYMDSGRGLSDDARQGVIDSINENGLTLIDDEDFAANVARRLETYRKAADGRPIKAYINVGGGAASVGTEVGKELFSPGLNTRTPARAELLTGVMPTLSQQGVPCIHLIHVTTLAQRYGLQYPLETAPAVGAADVFQRVEHNRPLVLAVLGLIVLSLYGFIRTDIGFRLLRGSGRSGQDGMPEPMV